MGRKRDVFLGKREAYPEEEWGLPTGRRTATSRKKAVFLQEDGALLRGRGWSSYGKKERYLEEEGGPPMGRRMATSRKNSVFRWVRPSRKPHEYPLSATFSFFFRETTLLGPVKRKEGTLRRNPATPRFPRERQRP
jgi:hypothetical protein